jgi:hypothetical protein
MTNGIEFDPGFSPYILAFQGSVNYMYMDINRFKNLSQKKMKFRQYYKKILEVFYNNLGFYVGCLMWAGYIKSQPAQEILNNPCLGQEYNEEENTNDPDFMLNFLELFPKDMKYFLGETFEFDSSVKHILEMYKEFLIINEGFINTKTSDNLKLPNDIKTGDAELYKSKIDSAISEGNLSLLFDCKDLILKDGVCV